MLRIILTVGSIQVLAIIVSLIRSKAVAVLLGPEGTGTVGVIDQIVQFTAYLSAFSLPLAAVKALSRAHSESVEEFRRQYSFFLRILLALSVIGTMVLIAIGLFRPLWFGRELSARSSILILGALSIPSMTLLGFFANVLAAAQRTRASASIAVITSASLAVGSCVGLLLGKVPGLYIGTAAVNLCLVTAVVFYLRRDLDLSIAGHSISWTAVMQEGRGLAAFAACMYLSTSAFSFSNLAARTSVIESHGAFAAGLLQAALALSASIGLVLTPTNGLFLTPLMNRSLPAAEKAKACFEFHKKLILVITVCAVGMATFPDLFLTFVFAPSFLPAVQFFYLLVIAQCLIQIAGIYQALLIGLDDLLPYGLISCASYVAIALLCRPLASRYGPAGVAYAMIAGLSLLLLLALARLRLRFAVRISLDLFGGTFYLLAATLSAGLMFQRQAPVTIPALLIKAAVFLALTCPVLVWVDHGQWLGIRNYIGQKLHGDGRVLAVPPAPPQARNVP